MELFNAGGVLFLVASVVFFGLVAWERLKQTPNKDSADWGVGLAATVLSVSALLALLGAL